MNGGQPWVDEEFKANDSALFKNPLEKPEYAADTTVEWKRPEEICQPEEPLMMKDGMTSGDVKQGAIGNCWLMGSFLLLGTRPQLLKNLIVEGESIKEGFAVF